MSESDEATPANLPRVLALSRRLATETGGNAVQDLREGASDDEVARRRGLPLATVHGVRSFYDGIERTPRVCDGTACRFGGAESVHERLSTFGRMERVRCLGHCYAAPAWSAGGHTYSKPAEETVEGWLGSWGEGAAPLPGLASIPRRCLAPRPVVLRHIEPHASDPDFGEYATPRAEEILSALEAAHLRGRGGALYPTAAKWRAARETAATERFVVANGDEGDPGSFVDRLLLEEDPHAILAGMKHCAVAIGARRGFVYVRGEYPRAQAIVREAIEEARARGHLGAEFDVEVVSGAGSYVCGEETALLASIEGLRGEPRPKPPYPATCGLWGLPTIVQNVETLAIVPWVARHATPAGTKAVSLSGALRRTGVAEIPLGMPLRRVLWEAGGGPPEGRAWNLALIGGPMGRVLPEREFDTPLSNEALPGLGHAGVVVLDESVRPADLARHLFEFARAESCGSCAPCRLGTAQLSTRRTRASLERLLETLEIGSLCGFGQGVPRPIRDLLEHFGDEVFA
jgi:NADH:ubiquinone oxidoreductase subunit F (NADH-binding)